MGQVSSKPGPISELLSEYDYVIDYRHNVDLIFMAKVGGGAAGCVLAARLTEDLDVTVALLETGSEETKEPLTDVPLLAPSLGDSGVMLHYNGEPQQHACKSLNEQTPRLSAGVVLGGGSSVNYMFYTRGSCHDYDEWEASGCEGWSYDDIIKYYAKAETYANAKQVIEDSQGNDGPVLLTDCAGFPKTTAAFLKAGEELGYPIVDLSTCMELGLGHGQQNVSGGRRISTVKAYLRPAMVRPNLHVITSALATKILFDGSRAVAVKYLSRNVEHDVYARREIIVSSGGIESPKLLLLSGVGPRQHLEQLEIPVVADLPVGEGLQVHIYTDGAAATLGNGDGALPRNYTSRVSQLKYNVFKKGFLAHGPCAGAGYFRAEHQPPEDPKPHIQLCAVPRLFSNHHFAKLHNIDTKVHKALYEGLEDSDGVTLVAMLCHPVSRGTIRLASIDPKVPPVIDPNYLENNTDVKMLAEGIRKGRSLLQTAAFKALSAEPLSRQHPGLHLDSDDYWEEYVKHMTLSMSHFTGTCRMGATGDPKAVVDPQLRVRGLQGLRVVDSSIMPEITSGNTHAPTIMIAEKAADMIRKSRSD